MRRIQILNITQSGVNPGTFTVGSHPDNPSGNWTAIFQGKNYRDAAGNSLPFYTVASGETPPAGYSLIKATTFRVVDNASYEGTYTVFTQPSISGLPSSQFSAGQTVIRVNEPVGPPATASHLTSGFITNVSTYFLFVVGQNPIIVPPQTIIEDRPIDFPGNSFTGWGEIFLQNLTRQAQNFAGSSAPTSPFVGQTWFNTTTSELRVWNGATWTSLAAASSVSGSFRHTQSVAASTWTINHNLNASSPFIVDASFFVDVGAGEFKPILPSDVTYTSANQLTVTFTTTYSGYALVRL